MKKIVRMFLSLLMIFMFAGISNAGTLPYGIGDISDFLGNNTYFNGYEEITSYDFSGEWRYTATAFESGNINYISESPGGTKTFTTANSSNFGVFDTVNFDTANLYFSDGYPANVGLDAFSKSDKYFRIFRLTAASDPFSYLSTNPVFAKDTLFVGFNDNGAPPIGDSDFDDIIVAMAPSQVPEPGTMLLLGTAIIGLAGLGRKWGNKK